MGAARSALFAGLAVCVAACVIAFSSSGVALASAGGALGWDEGYIGAFSIRLLTGHLLPYVDAVSHRGPLLYWMAALAQAAGGKLAWTGLHALSLLLVMATVVACAAVGMATRRPLAGSIGGLTYAYVLCVALPVQEGLAFNGEQASAPMAVFSLLAMTLAMKHGPDTRDRRTRLVMAGALVGLAALTKQTCLVLLAPYVVWLAAEARALGRTMPWRHLGALVAGMLAPVIAVLALYAARGELGTLVYWSITYNARVYMDPFREASRTELVAGWALREPILALVVGVLLASATARIFTRVRTLDASGLATAFVGQGFDSTVALLALVTVAGALSPLRFYGHYFVLAAPFVGFLAGLGVDRALSSGRRGASFSRGVFAALVLALAIPVSRARAAELHQLRP